MTATQNFSETLKKNDMFQYASDNESEINTELEALNIKAVTLFDKKNRTEELPDWDSLNFGQLTLCILPVIPQINDKGEQTVKELHDKGLTNKKTYHAVDLEESNTEEDMKKQAWTYYYPNRNLVVCTVNPFADENIWEETLSALKRHKLQVKDLDEIATTKLVKQWRATTKAREQSVKNNLEAEKRNLVSYETSYKQCSQRILAEMAVLASLEKSVESADKKMYEQLQEIKKLPFIKKISVGKTLDVSFGHVTITTNVQVGTKKEQGVTVPDVKKVKVNIGELTFHIGENIRVSNPSKVGHNEHPHSSDGNMCYGEEGVRMTRMLAEFELKQLITYLYSWCFSYVHTSAHLHINHFYEKNGGTIIQ